jgi:TRAP-type C4-dicarboxylate transport system substrate-binding protein
MPRKSLKWLIAHRPAYLFVRTAEAFAAELEKRCPGEFEIEILTMKEYIEKYNDIPEMRYRPRSIPGVEETPNEVFDNGTFVPADWNQMKEKWHAVFEAMKDDKFQLSQTQITVIGGSIDKKFRTLDLPYLFDDHEHVAKALDSELGETLCEEMGDRTGIRGLGFTYSGGYRIVGSNHPIESLNDLKTVNITTNPTTKVFFKKFAADADTRSNRTFDDIFELDQQGNSAIETTYLRFSGKHVLKTNHSMFLTTILVGDNFFKTLTPAQQKAFRESAKVVAKLERKWSIEDAEKYERNAELNGVSIKEITVEEEALMRSSISDQYENLYKILPESRDLVKEIKLKK